MSVAVGLRIVGRNICPVGPILVVFADVICPKLRGARIWTGSEGL